MYIFRGVFIDVYKADDKIATSGATSPADMNLRRTYRAIDSVATGRIPSLFCDCVHAALPFSILFKTYVQVVDLALHFYIFYTFVNEQFHYLLMLVQANILLIKT